MMKYRECLEGAFEAEEAIEYYNNVGGNGFSSKMGNSIVPDWVVQKKKKEAVDLGPILASCLLIVEAKAREKLISVDHDFDKSLPPLAADPLRLKQILINLLGNAVKFTPEKGRVRVAASVASADTALITVEDNGIGMSPEEIETALRPFGQVDSAFNKRHEGTGLGLPIAYALARLHGGDLRIASQKGVGTRICLSLPLLHSPDTAAHIH